MKIFRYIPFIVLAAGMIVLSVSCNKEKNLPYPVDQNGFRMVKSINRMDTAGRSGDLYYFSYKEGYLEVIENVRWNVRDSDTLRIFRKWIVNPYGIIGYDSSGRMTAQGSNTSGILQESFAFDSSGNTCSRNLYRYSGSCLLRIEGDYPIEILWENARPTGYIRNGKDTLRVQYGGWENKTNMNLTDDFFGGDRNLPFYGWETFCGLRSPYFAEEGPYMDSDERSLYSYTNDSFGCPLVIKEKINGKTVAVYEISYY